MGARQRLVSLSGVGVFLCVAAPAHATTPRGDCHQRGSFTGAVVSVETITLCPELDAQLQPPDAAAVPPDSSCLEGFIYLADDECKARRPRIRPHVRTGRVFTELRLDERGFYRTCKLGPGSHQLAITGQERTIELEAGKTLRIDHRIGGKKRWRIKVEITNSIGEEPKKGEAFEFLARFSAKPGESLTARGRRDYRGAWEVRRCVWPLGHYDPPAFTPQQMGRRGGKGCCNSSGSPAPGALVLIALCSLVLARRRARRRSQR